jgi:hypothetical protein
MPRIWCVLASIASLLAAVGAGGACLPESRTGGSTTDPPGTGGSATGPTGAGGRTTGPTGSGGASTVPGGSGGAPTPPPATGSEAARPYTITAVTLDAALVPAAGVSGGNGAELPVSIDAATGAVYVGFTRTEGTARSAVIAPAGGGAPITVAGAVNAGIAATKDGVAVLVFDPNTSVDARTWAAVKRFGRDGVEMWSRDLFRSPNLDDVGTKGAPSTSRLGYLPATDEVLAYFGHTQRYDDGVRHQGGFVGRMAAAGALEVLGAWWGSHNLDQRLLVRSSAFTLIGLGDAYPEGIFFGNAAARMRTTVIHPLAAAGNGATNGQLGGMVDLGDVVLVPFITNRSIPQDLDAGVWPDIDEAISMQIRSAAQNGTDLGLLVLDPAATIPAAGLAAVWTDPQRPAAARLERLKSARYGTGGLALLAFAEATGSGRTAARSYFTMVVDRAGAVCQAKTPLDAAYAPTAGDDLVRAPDGRIIWANPQGGRIQVVTLTPG